MYSNWLIKGSTGEQMKEAGILAKEAGMILSEFILLGLGGKKIF